jgi:hypothetical protein
MGRSDEGSLRSSRSGVTSPLGKLTAEIPKLKVPEETREILEGEARKAGLTLSEFVRDLLIIRAHGEDAVKSLYARRVAVVAGTGGE